MANQLNLVPFEPVPIDWTSSIVILWECDGQ